MARIVDRRRNPKGASLGNRQRFIRRARSHIRRAVRDNLKHRGVADTDSGETVSIPTDGVHEPRFVEDAQSGAHERVLPGNREFVEGDQIPRPDAAGGGTGPNASERGEGEDAFTFELSGEEFLDILFEDLELPDMVKGVVAREHAPLPQRHGFSRTGSPVRLNFVRTMRLSMARRVALGRPTQAAIDALERELAQLRRGEIQPADGRSPEARIAELEDALERAYARRGAVPYIDPFDLRYNYYENEPRPIARAVMFCLMDVSASMDQDMKDLAKRFFMLLHLFLKRQYEHVELVFVRHTHMAQEVDEDEFFHGRQTGGTVVSSALEEMLRIIDERYPPDDWNIYLAQASDGDDIPKDVPRCIELLDQHVLPVCQYAAYVEIPRQSAHGVATSQLWTGYGQLAEFHPHFAMRQVTSPADIYPVFRDLFRRAGAEA